MTSAGVYNEEVFSSLDWILDQASRRGLRLILPFEVCFRLSSQFYTMPQLTAFLHVKDLNVSALLSYYVESAGTSQPFRAPS